MNTEDNLKSTPPLFFQYPYIILLIISTAILVISKNFQEFPNVQQLGYTFSIGVFSSYLTAVLVDGAFRKKEKREYIQRQNVALTKFQLPLNTYLYHLRVLYRSSIKEVPSSPPESFQYLIENGEFEKLRLLDFGTTYPIIGMGDDYMFLNESVRRIENFTEEIDKVLDQYSIFLEPDLVQKLQELKTCDYFRLMATFNNIDVMGDKPLALLSGDVYLDFEEHLMILEEILKYYENPSAPELSSLDITSMWLDNEKPEIGSARLDLSFDEVKQVELSEEPPHKVFNEEVYELLGRKTYSESSNFGE